MCQEGTPKDSTPGGKETREAGHQERADVLSTGAKELGPAISEDTPDINDLINGEAPEEAEQEPKIRRSKRTTRAGTSFPLVCLTAKQRN